jgi:hypothetical protein
VDVLLLHLVPRIATRGRAFALRYGRKSRHFETGPVRKSDLELKLKSGFSATKWQLERVARLPLAFVRRALVTPFFQPRVLRRSGAHYLIDGYLGVVHRGFESQWLKLSPETPKQNFHCLALNIANVDALRAEHYLTVAETDDETDDDILKFCDVALDRLGALPHDETALVSALKSNTLLNMPLEKFIIHGRAERLSSLRAYLSENCAGS